MRRFLTYFNALLFGVILGMIFVAIVHAIPSDPQEASGIGQKTLAISMSLARCAHEQDCALRNWAVRPLFDR
jgi:hypothetical protein